METFIVQGMEVSLQADTIHTLHRGTDHTVLLTPEKVVGVRGVHFFIFVGFL